MPSPVSADNRIDDIGTYPVLVSGSMLDELTGAAPSGVLSVSLPAANLVIRALVFIKVLDGGLYCLAGYPERIFSDLNNTDKKELVLRFHVPGYKDQDYTLTIPRGSTFPLPAVAPLLMQRQPIRIQGRVVGMNATPTPIGGAQISFVDEPNPPTALTEHVVALRTPLYFDYADIARTTVNQRPVNASNVSTQLAASVDRCSNILTVSDRTGMAVNDLLLVGSDAAGEYVIIVSLPQDAPGQVILRNKLNYSFASGTVVRKYLPGASGTSTTLTRQASAGEGVLFLPINLAGASTDLIEIADTTAALDEYHALGAVTDANGYYRLDGITRVQTVYMDASAAGYAVMQEPVAWTVDYGQPVNIVDFRLLP